MRPSKTPRFVVLLTVAALTSACAVGKTQKDTLRETTTIEGLDKLTPAQSAELSSIAVKAVRHIAEARADVQKDRYDDARKSLDQANTLLTILNDELPMVRVSDRITLAKKHLEYEDTKKVQADLVPVYSELDILTEEPKRKEARQHLDQANQSLQRGDKKAAQAELAKLEEVVAYQQVSIPVDRTQELVRRARQALDGKHYAEAKQLLASAEHTAVVDVVAVVDPGSKAAAGDRKGSR